MWHSTSLSRRCSRNGTNADTAPTLVSSNEPGATPTASNGPPTPVPHTTGHPPSIYTASPKTKLSGIGPGGQHGSLRRLTGGEAHRPAPLVGEESVGAA